MSNHWQIRRRRRRRRPWRWRRHVGLVLSSLFSMSPVTAETMSTMTTSLASIFASTASYNDSSSLSNNSTSNSSFSNTIDYAWQRMGNYDLTGPYLHGWSLALNKDGTVLAVGSIHSNGPFGDSEKSGMVTIYQWTLEEQQSSNTTTTSNALSTQWQTTQLHGLEAGDQCGYSVSLDGTGTVLGECCNIMDCWRSSCGLLLGLATQISLLHLTHHQLSPFLN
jgi:hypothetical protein